jgi:hypothetical protein
MQFLTYAQLRPEVLKEKLKKNAKALKTAPALVKPLLLQERDLLKRHLRAFR